MLSNCLALQLYLTSSGTSFLTRDQVTVTSPLASLLPVNLILTSSPVITSYTASRKFGTGFPSAVHDRLNSGTAEANLVEKLIGSGGFVTNCSESDTPCSVSLTMMLLSSCSTNSVAISAPHVNTPLSSAVTLTKVITERVWGLGDSWRG